MIDWENLLVLLFLLPGFLAARVYARVAVQKRKTQLEAISEILLFEFLVLAAFAWISLQGAWVPVRPEGRGLLAASAPALSLLAILAVFLGSLFGSLHDLDQPLSLLRALGLTKQSSHPTVWQSAFYNRPRWVVVHLESGERILGWPELFADTPEESAVFLADAAYLDEDGTLTEIRGPGIFISKEARIRLVEFLASPRTPRSGWNDE